MTEPKKKAVPKKKKNATAQGTLNDVNKLSREAYAKRQSTK